MSILVVGASGATGRLVVGQLLDQDKSVKIIVRSTQTLPQRIIQHPKLMITEASLLDMTDRELQQQVRGCEAIVSCLGHNLSFKGIFGRPRRLVTDSVTRLCQAIENSNHDGPVKFLLMNTTGNQNKQAGEKINLAQFIVVSLLRCLLPPHADNEDAAAWLQSHYNPLGQNIEWVAIRPDSLSDEDAITAYDIFPSPVRNPIFDAGTTSRVNVAGFITQLIINADMWRKWRGQMPVIYNCDV